MKAVVEKLIAERVDADNHACVDATSVSRRALSGAAGKAERIAQPNVT